MQKGLKRSGEWVPFGEGRFVRKLRIYEDLEWAVDLGTALHAAVAPFGGPVAVVDECEPSTVEVYSAVGRKLFDATVPGDAGRIVCVGWSCEETLVVLTAKPACYLWIHARQAFHHVKLPRALVSGGEPTLAHICPAGCIVGNGTAIGVVLFVEKREPAVYEVDVGAHAAEVTCGDIIPAHFSEDDAAVAVLGGRSTRSQRGALVTVKFEYGDATAALVTSSLPRQVAAIAVSPDGEHVAFATEGGLVVSTPSDFSRFSSSLHTGVKTAPSRLCWCGSAYLHLLYKLEELPDALDVGHLSVVLSVHERSEVKDTVKWDLEGGGYVICVAEPDGMRIVSDRMHHFFEVVPQPLADIFAHGSTALTAAVCSAAALAASKSIEGITKLRTVCGNAGIYDAMDAIVEAASCEFTAEAQEQLLAVVATVKSQARVRYDSDAYVDVCRRLRLYNSVRDARNAAVPISHHQYRLLSGAAELRLLHSREAQVLVDRLVQRGDYQWAVKIATYMGMKVDKILVQWSVAKVIAAHGDAEDTAREIVDVLRTTGASLADAAMEAFAQEKHRLALKLLDAEPRSQSQVLLLLQMGHDSVAMEKAVASRDADLTYLVLLKLKESMTKPAFHDALKQYVTARMQYLAASQHSRALSRSANEFLKSHGSERHVAVMELAAAFAPPERIIDDDCVPEDEDEDDGSSDPTARKIEGTQRVTPELMTEAEGLFQANEQTREEARLCAMHRDLLDAQQGLISHTGDTSVLNTSITQTLRHALVNGLEDEAEKLRRRFNVPDKKFWYTKLLALAASKQWDALERMGGVGKHKAVKSPIGFLPFVETLYEASEPQRAVPYVARLPTLVQRIEWYVKLDEFQKAVDDAYDDDNVHLLQQIRKRSQNPSMLAYIDERIKALS